MKSADPKYWYQAEDVMSLLRNQPNRIYDVRGPIPNNEVQATQAINDAIENLQERPIALPFKIDDQRFAGVVLRKLDDGGISAHYYDPSGRQIPTFLSNILKSSCAAQVSHSPPRRQGAECDCGPWTVSSLHDMATAKSPFQIPNLLEKSAKKPIESQRKRLSELIVKTQIDQQITHIRNEFFPDNGKSILGEFSDNAHTNTPSNPNTRVAQLNLVSKLFTRVPYSALLEKVDDRSTTYLSLPNGMTLDGTEIRELLGGLQEVIDNPQDQNCKRELFIRMLKTKNNLLIDYIIRGRGKNSGLRKIAERALKGGLTDEELNSEKFKEFVNAHFDNIFPPAALVGLDLQSVNIEVLPISYETKTHVEMRGASYLHNKGIEDLNIGLSNPKNEDPTCCAGCTVERMVVQEVLGLTLHVPATSSDNFPPASYNPSSLINSPEVCTEFLLQMEAVLVKKYATQQQTPEKAYRLKQFLEEREKLATLVTTIQDIEKSRVHNISASTALVAQQILRPLGNMQEYSGVQVSPTSTPGQNAGRTSPIFPE